jgi:hypothetical protein
MARGCLGLLVFTASVNSNAYAELLQIGPVMFLEEDSIRFLPDSHALVLVLQNPRNDHDIVEGVKSIASQMILDCTTRGRQSIGASIGFPLVNAQGEATVIQPPSDTPDWIVFTYSSAALRAWQRVCIF